MTAPLQGQRALITAGASGIGRAIARRFVEAGAKVFVCDVDRKALDAFAAETPGTGGALCDVADPAQVDAMFAAAEQALGGLDILVNNAGIAVAGAAHEMPVDLWDRVIAVHLRGTFLVTRAVLPHMYASGYGRIINTASQLAYKGAPGFAAYTAAKGAILSFTRSTALEIGARDITINCVAPGATRTPMLDGVPREVLEAIRSAIPLGRLATVEDIAPSYVFLASDAGRHYQGQCLSPNGGDVFL